MISTRLEELLELYNRQVKRIEEIENSLKSERETLRILTQETMPDVLAEYGANEVKVGEHWFRMKGYVSPKINEERYDEALNWIETSGYGSVKINCIIPLSGNEEVEKLNGKLDGWTRIYERKIHHKTLEAAVKRMIADDVLIPDNLITVLQGNYCKID